MNAQSTPSGTSDGGEPCITCGACCFSRLETYVPVRGDDYARLGSAAEALVWFAGNRAYLVMTNGQCAALVFDGDGEAPRFVCSVYVNRPATCRELDRGSPACDGERSEKSERPRAASDLVRLRVRTDVTGKDSP